MFKNKITMNFAWFALFTAISAAVIISLFSKNASAPVKCSKGATLENGKCVCTNKSDYNTACDPACCSNGHKCDSLKKTCVPSTGPSSGCSSSLTVSKTTGLVTGELKVNGKCTEVNQITSSEFNENVKEELNNLCAATTCEVQYQNDVRDPRCTLPTDTFEGYSLKSRKCSLGPCNQEANYYWPNGSHLCPNLKLQAGTDGSCNYPDNSHLKLACTQDNMGCGVGHMSDPLVCGLDTPCYKESDVNTSQKCLGDTSRNTTMCTDPNNPCLKNGTGTKTTAAVCLPETTVPNYRCPIGYKTSSSCLPNQCILEGESGGNCVPQIPDYVCSKPTPVCPAGTSQESFPDNTCNTGKLPCYNSDTKDCVALKVVKGCRSKGENWVWEKTACVSKPSNLSLQLTTNVTNTLELSGTLSFTKASEDDRNFGDYQFRYRLSLQSNPDVNLDDIVTNVSLASSSNSCPPGSICAQYNVWLPSSIQVGTYNFFIQAGYILDGSFFAMYGSSNPTTVNLTQASKNAQLPAPVFSLQTANCLAKQLWENVTEKRILTNLPVKSSALAPMPQSSQSVAAVIPCSNTSCSTNSSGEIDKFLVLLCWTPIPNNSLTKLCPQLVADSNEYKIIYTLAKVPVSNNPQPISPGEDLRNKFQNDEIVWQGEYPGPIDLPANMRCQPMPQSGELPIMAFLDSLPTNTAYAYYLFAAAGKIKGVNISLDTLHNCFSPPATTIVGPLHYSGTFCASIPTGSSDNMLDFLVYNPNGGGCQTIAPGEEAQAAFYACMFRHPTLLKQKISPTQLWVPNTPKAWGESNNCAVMNPTLYPKMITQLNSSIENGYCNTNNACNTNPNNKLLLNREARCGCPETITTGLCRDLSPNQLPAVGLYNNQGPNATPLNNVIVSQQDFTTQVNNMTNYMCKHCLFTSEQKDIASAVCSTTNDRENCGY